MRLQHNSTWALRQGQRGSAAVELAVLLPVLVVFLAFPYFYARFFWHYSVAEKAAQDAARYLSSISVQEMRSPTLNPAAVAAANQIAITELAELRPGHAAATVSFLCGANPCQGFGGAPLPPTVRVHVAMDMFDASSVVNTGRYGMPIRVDAEMAYVGN